MRISDWSSDVCSSDLVAGRAGALSGKAERALGCIGERGSRHVGNMRLFPALRLNRGILGKHIGGAVQPSMPFGRHARRLGRAVVDHPAPPALLGLIIDIALRILPDAAAEPAGMELRAECRPIPPGRSEGPTSKLQSLMR